MSALNQQVLILDKNYMPVQICLAKQAIPLFYVDKMVALEADWTTHDFDSWVIRSKELLKKEPNLSHIVRSPTIVFVVPEVFVITDFVQAATKKRNTKYNRSSVFKRDNYTCQYCAKRLQRKELTIDHVVPRSRGGPTNWLNCVSACKKCNTKKDNKTPEEAGMALLSKPRIPNWKDHLQFNSDIKEMWEHFL